jgi:hypothetical protein
VAILSGADDDDDDGGGAPTISGSQHEPAIGCRIR